MLFPTTCSGKPQKQSSSQIAPRCFFWTMSLNPVLSVDVHSESSPFSHCPFMHPPWPLHWPASHYVGCWPHRCIGKASAVAWGVGWEGCRHPAVLGLVWEAREGDAELGHELPRLKGRKWSFQEERWPWAKVQAQTSHGSYRDSHPLGVWDVRAGLERGSRRIRRGFGPHIMEGSVCCIEMFGLSSWGNGDLWKNFVGGWGVMTRCLSIKDNLRAVWRRLGGTGRCRNQWEGCHVLAFGSDTWHCVFWLSLIKGSGSLLWMCFLVWFQLIVPSC